MRGELRGPDRQHATGGLPASGPRRVHAALVGVEVALALLLVAGATMFTRSVQRLYAIDTGFDPADVTLMNLVAPTRLMPAPARSAFFDEVVERVQGLPGVRAAGFVTRVPLRDGGGQGTVTIEDRPDLLDGREPDALFRVVSPGYVTAMGIGVVQGRLFTAGDAGGARPVGMVSAAFAERPVRLLQVAGDDCRRLVGDVVLGERRQVALAIEVARDLPLVFLEQAVRIVFGWPWKYTRRNWSPLTAAWTPASALSTRMPRPASRNWSRPLTPVALEVTVSGFVDSH